MVAIEHSAARDRHLFPDVGRIDGKSVQVNPMENSTAESPLKKHKTDLMKVSLCCLFNGNPEIGCLHVI